MTPSDTQLDKHLFPESKPHHDKYCWCVTSKPEDTIGWKIVQSHAPFFKPSELAKAIDAALIASQVTAERERLLNDPGDSHE